MPRVAEVFVRYERALAANATWVVVAAVAAVAYVAVTSRRRELPLPRWAPTAALGVIALGAIVWAWQLRWLSDDAFISFRYARNWVDGHGLVFNLGERVEGYTNFLWMAMLALAYLVGLDVPATAIVLCLASHVGVLVMTTRLVRQLAPEDRPVIVSLAAVALAASYLAATYATGGLETTFGALLVLAAVDRARAGRVLAAGALGIAATMAHPDHAIFYVALGAVLVFRRTPWRQLVRYAAPFAVVFVPYFLLRWSYFGMPMPNTYYTKSAGDSYFSQGGLYLIASSVGAGLIGSVPLAVFGAVRRVRDLSVQFAIVAVPIYLLYVAKIGGDFMLGRLLIPALPFGFALAETGIRILLAEGRWKLALPALVIAGLACVPTPLLGSEEFKWYLTDERTFYRLESLRPLVLRGAIPHRVAVLHKYFAGRQPPLVYAASAIGILGWTTDWRVVDLHGLIDPELSREPLARRGRPGHERTASPAHVVKRGADLSAFTVYDPSFDLVTKLILDGETYSLTRYRPELLDPLRAVQTATFVRFPEYIDMYTSSVAARSVDDVRKHLAFFDQYYFAGNPDPARRAPLVERLSAPPAPPPAPLSAAPPPP